MGDNGRLRRCTRLLSAAALAAVTIASSLLADGASHTPRAYAASIVVNSLADNLTTDGQCTLREAMVNANNNAATHADCVAGSGADTITFTLSGTITLTSPLPDISDPQGLTVDGAGQTVAVSGGGAHPVLGVAPAGVGEVRNLTLKDGFTSVVGQAGGIRNSGVLTLERVVLRDGASDAPFPPGDAPVAGIRNLGTLTLKETTVRDNVGRGIFEHGGIVNLGSLLVRGSTISGNAGWVGGIFNAGSGTALLVNSTVSGNSGVNRWTHGPGIGGISSGTGVMTLVHTTVTGNSGAPGGISAYLGEFKLIQSLVAGNTEGDCSGPVTFTGRNHVGILADPSNPYFYTFGIVCEVASGPTPITGPASLAALGENGGFTQTHALQAGSPAANSGAPDLCLNEAVGGVDQRGVARPQGAACDLGAFESAVAGRLGGVNLRVADNPVRLAWDYGTLQDHYVLLRVDMSSGAATLIELPRIVEQYSDGDASTGVTYCYALAAVGSGAVMGLSDVLCVRRGAGTGDPPQNLFTLTKRQDATVLLQDCCASPDQGLIRLPLDGSSSEYEIFPGLRVMILNPSGECFQRVVGVGTWLCALHLAAPAIGSKVSALNGVAERLAGVSLPGGGALRWEGEAR